MIEATAIRYDRRIGSSTASAVDAEVGQLQDVADDLQRSLAQERAMARTLIDTVKRLDLEGEILRRQAKA